MEGELCGAIPYNVIAMKIKVTADSTCDLTPELIEKYDIEIVPLYVVKGENSYLDTVEINPSDVFEYFDNGQGLCKTSAVNVDRYKEIFARNLKEYDAIIHIDISSDMSSCYQNACMAASEFENVYPIDSRNLSTASGHLVLEACLMAQQGLEAKDIADKLNELAGKLEASFVIDKLTYLHKGGRCSSLAALGANILKLKPCIEVVDGVMGVGKKYRGSFEQAIDKYTRERLEGRNDVDYKRIFITHTTCVPEIIQIAKDNVMKYGKFEEIIETTAGCTISCHCGPNTLGILFFRK